MDLVPEGETAGDVTHDCCHGDAAASAAPAGAYDTLPPGYDGPVYTCPMHLEVRAPKPGPCPLCGMALEPEDVTVGEEDTSELRDMTRRFWVSTILTIPLFIYAMGDLIPDRPFERFWRVARVERLWDGTSEIQRHIISRDILRKLGA